MDRSSLRWKSQEVSWASQSDLEMEMLSSDISRVLYFFVIGKKAILTNGFIKKTQKTPPGEIEKAKAYRKEYLSRKENV